MKSTIKTVRNFLKSQKFKVFLLENPAVKTNLN